MLDREIKQIFVESDKKMIIDEQRRDKTIAYLMQQMDCSKEYSHVDTRQIIRNQIRYMDKTILWIQFGVELMVAFIFLRLGILDIPKDDIIAYATIFSGIIGVLVPAATHRSFASNMMELSEACYFNTKQMVVFQMVYSSIGSLVLLTIAILFIGVKWQVNLLQIGLYMLVPFLFSCCCCLGVILTEVGRRSSYIFVVVGLFTGIFHMILASMPYLYQASALLFWGIALVAGICIFAMQLNRLFRYIDKGEILCMN